MTHHPTAMPTGSYVLSVIATVLLAILAAAVLVIAPRGAQLPDPDPINLRFRRRGTGERPAR
ncbi:MULTISPECIES: hypothetical protein [unclassified Nocardia]|uniref:hypothetical protein n=1 Tax=unclassified Nocardia TaxID=2637762 RepID=UPI001CE3E4DF|nr:MULTISPECIES: hypothetical protein [unclassified Nocardia]